MIKVFLLSLISATALHAATEPRVAKQLISANVTKARAEALPSNDGSKVYRILATVTYNNGCEAGWYYNVSVLKKSKKGNYNIALANAYNNAETPLVCAAVLDPVDIDVEVLAQVEDPNTVVVSGLNVELP